MPRVCWLGRIGSEGFEGGGFRGDKHFPHHDRFADGFATARDAEAEPDAEGREEDGDERAIELDGVLDDDEAVFGVLEGGDEEAADETEDEDVALHDRAVKKYILAYPERRRPPCSANNSPLEMPIPDPNLYHSSRGIPFSAYTLRPLKALTSPRAVCRLQTRD